MVETGRLPAEGVQRMFDRIAPVYDAMNRVMTGGLDRRWRRITVEQAVRAGDRVLDACCGTGDLALAARSRGAARWSGSTSRPRCSSARGRRGPASSGCRATCSRSRSRTSRSTPRRSASASATSTISRPAFVSCGACCGRAAGSRSSRSRPRAALLAPFYRFWFDRVVPLLGKVLPGGDAYTYLPASVRRFPAPAELARLLERTASARCDSAVCRGYRGASRGGDAHDDDRHETLAAIRETPGLEEYLDALEERLARSVASHPGLVAAVGTRRSPPAASGCGRCSSSSRRLRARSRRSPPASPSSSCTWRRSSTTT